MALTEDDKKELWAKFMQDVSSRQEKFGQLSKHDIRAAVDAIDGWIDDNLAAFNTAIPQPARSELTAKQKAEIFFAIAGRRWEVS